MMCFPILASKKDMTYQCFEILVLEPLHDISHIIKSRVGEGGEEVEPSFPPGDFDLGL